MGRKTRIAIGLLALLVAVRLVSSGGGSARRRSAGPIDDQFVRILLENRPRETVGSNAE